MNLVKVNGLTKLYDQHYAVDQISFRIEQGHCVCLIGPNGAGKTTALNMLAGIARPTSGTIQFHGKVHQDIRNNIGYLPQFPSFYAWMNAQEYLVFAAQLSGFPRKEAVKRSDEMLELVGLIEAKNKRIGGFSGGMKQRLGIAQAFIHRPLLLILDEPVSALDPLGRREVLNLLKKIKDQTTILFSTHILHDAEEISDDLLMIRKGSLAVQGSLQEVLNQYQKPYVTLQVESLSSDWLEEMRRLPMMNQIQITQNSIQIRTDSIEQLKQIRTKLLKIIAAHEVPVRKIELGHTTLEEIFMEVVQSE